MLRRGKHGQTCGNCFNPCLSFEFLQLSSVFGLQHVANEQILFGVIKKIGRFKSFSAESSMPAKYHTPFPLPISFGCAGGMELCFHVWCFYLQT